MGRADLERLSKEELSDLVLELQRPAPTSRTSSTPPSADRMDKREGSRPGAILPAPTACLWRAAPDCRRLNQLFSCVDKDLEHTMLSHTHLGVSELERAVAFYRAVMDSLGYVLKFHEPENGWAGWMRPGQPRPLFLIGRPYNGGPPSPGNGVMVALLAPDRPTVDRTHNAALACGGTNEGTPGLRPHCHQHYYGAYVRDPDGNKLGICCHEPPEAPRA